MKRRFSSRHSEEINPKKSLITNEDGISILKTGNLAFILAGAFPLLVAVVVIILILIAALAVVIGISSIAHGLGLILIFGFIMILIGSLVYFVVIAEFAKIICLFGLLVLCFKSKTKLPFRIDLIALMILAISIIGFWISIILLVYFFVTGEKSEILDVALFFLMAFAASEFISISLFSFSNSLVALLFNKVKVLPIINMSSCVILAIIPALLYYHYGLTPEGANFLFYSFIILILIGVIWAFINMISFKKIENENSIKKKSIERKILRKPPPKKIKGF